MLKAESEIRLWSLRRGLIDWLTIRRREKIPRGRDQVIARVRCTGESTPAAITDTNNFIQAVFWKCTAIFCNAALCGQLKQKEKGSKDSGKLAIVLVVGLPMNIRSLCYLLYRLVFTLITLELSLVPLPL